MKKLIFTLALAIAASGCEGDDGEPGPAGPQGPPGVSGDQGPAGVDATGQPVDQGLVIDIRSATVTEGAAPTVTFLVRDARGTPVDLKAESVAGAFRPTIVLSRLGADGKWNSYLVNNRAGAEFDHDGDPATPAQAPALTTATQATGQAICSGACPQQQQDRLVAQGNGVFTYTFAGPVSGVDANATHRVGIYGSRTFNGAGQPGSATFDFVPAGGQPQQRDIVTDEACARCHTVVNAHGGSRRGVKLCLTCHSPQTVDPETGNNVDMALMIHKIHKGAQLANGYTIVGFGQRVFDFTHVQMGPSHSTYFDTTPTSALASSDRGIVRECALCHQGAQAQAHQTSISTANCTTCHDDVNPGEEPVVQNTVTVPRGTNHGVNGNVGASNAANCVTCHGPEGSNPLLRVATVHSTDFETVRNLQFPPEGERRYALRIDAVNGLQAGNATPPTIDFTVTLNGNPLDLGAQVPNDRTADPNDTFAAVGKLGSLGFSIAGPITDIAEVLPASTTRNNFGVTSALSGGALSAQVTPIDAAAGRYRFTYATNPVPAGRTGVYVVSFESFYRESQTGTNPATGETALVAKPYAADPIFHDVPNQGAAVDERNVRFVDVETGTDVTTVGTGASAVRTERRKIVENAKCNNCHEDLGFHGNRSRQGVDYCATCHNPNLDNSNRTRLTRAEGSLLAESVSINVFIHKIHMGAELSQPYRLGTNRGATAGPGDDGFADFSQFVAPSPMGNCQTCHDGLTYDLPDTPNLRPVKRTPITCGPTTTGDQVVDGVTWCGDRQFGTPVFTPPQQAVCQGCHDTVAAKAHFDLNTLYPAGQTAATYNPYTGVLPLELGAQPDPSRTALESCATCHARGRDFDVIVKHPPVLAPTVDLPDSP